MQDQRDQELLAQARHDLSKAWSGQPFTPFNINAPVLSSPDT